MIFSYMYIYMHVNYKNSAQITNFKAFKSGPNIIVLHAMYQSALHTHTSSLCS